MQYLLLRTNILQKRVVGCPWLILLDPFMYQLLACGLGLTQGIKVDFIYVFIYLFIIVFPTNPVSSYTGKMFRNGKERV